MNFSVFQTSFRRSQPLNLFEKQKNSFDMLNNSNNNNNNNNNSNSNNNKDIFAWNTSQMITKAVSISTRIVVNYAKKRGIPFEFQ